MFRHGLFDHPVTSAPMDLPEDLLAGHAVISRTAAEDSIVLLKNQGGLLPLGAEHEACGGYRRPCRQGRHRRRRVVAGLSSRR
ncbi:hypothetical protein ACRAWD_10440 [Caulobacter segnis]